MESAELRPPRPGVLSGTAVWRLLASDDSSSETCGSEYIYFEESRKMPLILTFTVSSHYYCLKRYVFSG